MLNVPWHTTQSTNIYLDNKVLTDEVQSCIDNDRTCSDTLAMHFQTMIDHIADSRSWCGYPADWKDEMKSFAMLKCMKSMKTVDLAKCQKVFNYYSRTIYLAFCTVRHRLKRIAENETSLFERR